MRRNGSIALALGLIAPALLIWGCGGDDGGDGGTGPPPAATTIAAVSGGGQAAQAGSQLPAPFVVRVTDAQGGGVSGVGVSWSVTAGGGSLSAASTSSNSQGQASVTLTLGPAAGQNTVTATAAGLSGSPVTFSATGTAPPSAPDAVALVSGDNQHGKTLAPLASPFVVKVSDDQGVGVAGVTVSWAVATGGGSLSASSTTTNGSGQASVTFTSGTATGESTVTASVAGLTGSPVTFSARTSVLVIEMSGIAFVYPDGSTNSDATVAVGDTIEWINLDGVQHTATSNVEPAGGAAFDSGLMANGATFRFAPAVVGMWEYFCQVHPALMAGAKITVQ